MCHPSHCISLARQRLRESKGLLSIADLSQCTERNHTTARTEQRTTTGLSSVLTRTRVGGHPVTRSKREVTTTHPFDDRCADDEYIDTETNRECLEFDY